MRIQIDPKTAHNGEASLSVVAQYDCRVNPFTRENACRGIFVYVIPEDVDGKPLPPSDDKVGSFKFLVKELRDQTPEELDFVQATVDSLGDDIRSLWVAKDLQGIVLRVMGAVA